MQFFDLFGKWKDTLMQRIRLMIKVCKYERKKFKRRKIPEMQVHLVVE